MNWLEICLSTTFWVALVRIATPYMFGTLGELICERAGVINLGIEGIMVSGAFAGWLTVHAGGSLSLGVLAAFAAGALFGLLHGTITVIFGASQHVTGIAITLLAASLAYFDYRMLFPHLTTPPQIQGFTPLPIPYLASIPVLGPAFFAQTPLTYVGYLVATAVTYLLYRTPLGLAVRTAGENPLAVEAQGIDVIRLRLGAVILGSGLMAIGGAFLTLSASNAFYFNMVNGRGWICIALVVFASWRPGKAVLGALLFAAFDAYQLRLQQIVGARVPYQLFLMLPYLLSILALVIASRRAAAPASLMLPYRKGER
jgi:general nucleoside transport system permease protein